MPFSAHVNPALCAVVRRMHKHVQDHGRKVYQRKASHKPGTGASLHTQEPVTVASFRTWRGWRENVARDRCLTKIILTFDNACLGRVTRPESSFAMSSAGVPPAVAEASRPRTRTQVTIGAKNSRQSLPFLRTLSNNRSPVESSPVASGLKPRSTAPCTHASPFTDRATRRYPAGESH